MIINLGDDPQSYRQTYLICLTRPISEAALRRRARVKDGTYAGDLIALLHDAIFYRSLELRHDYAEYFAVEYSSFQEYVRRRFRFDDDVVEELTTQFADGALIILFEAGYGFVEGDYGRQFLERLLEPRRRS